MRAVLETLFCVPGAVGLVSGRITNLVCSFPCTACISLARPGEAEWLIMWHCLKVLMIYV